MEELKAEYDSIEQREMAATKARIETLRNQVGKELADAIRTEQGRGVPVSKIAARLGYKSRNTVYTLLRAYPTEEVATALETVRNADIATLAEALGDGDDWERAEQIYEVL